MHAPVLHAETRAFRCPRKHKMNESGERATLPTINSMDWPTRVAAPRSALADMDEACCCSSLQTDSEHPLKE